MSNYYELKVFDLFGEEKEWDWVLNKYGDVEIHTPQNPAATYYQIIGLREAAPSPNLYATVLDVNGAAVIGQQVIFYWPGGDDLPGTGWLERGLSIPTVAAGAAEFPMGPGAGYAPGHPEHPKGPHAVWVRGENVSEMISGVGWLWGDPPHIHLNVMYREVPSGIPPQPSTGIYKVDLVVSSPDNKDKKMYSVKGTVSPVKG